MPTIISSTLRSALRQPGDPLNILSFPTHEAYQSGFAKDGNSWYLFQSPGIKTWHRHFRPLPDNHTLLDGNRGDRQLPPDVVFDVIVSQNRLGVPASQFQIAESLSKSLHVPHVALEHTLPHPDWSVGRIRRLREMEADYNVFIGNYQRDAWTWHEDEAVVIHHGIDTDVFSPPPPEVTRRQVLLSVVNDWINRDWCCGFRFWRETTQNLPCFVVGDTPGLSKAAATLEELIWRYQTCSIFVNTSTVSPVPTSLLEAMSCGCAILSTDTCMIPGIIEDGVNGYRTNDRDRFRRLAERLLADPEECRVLGQRARETIREHFSATHFSASWASVLARAASSLPRIRDVISIS